MTFSLPESSEFLVPDGIELTQAIERTTHFAVVAHPDDLEIAIYHGIAECYEREDRWFSGIICTDGAGSVLPPGVTKEELPGLRWREQCEAARSGKYSMVIGLRRPSNLLQGRIDSETADVIERAFEIAKPEIVYSHNPFDRHATHAAVCLHTIEALRRIKHMPRAFYGCEGWRDLDWLPAPWRVELDAGAMPELAARVLSVYFSQIDVGKRYDLATLGRRSAHATFAEPRAVDRTLQLTLAADLMPLLHEPERSVLDFAEEVLEKFHEEVIGLLASGKES